MKAITLEHSKIILEKMFNAIGQKYTDSFVQYKDWYTKYTWTKPEWKEEFLVWLSNFLIEHKYTTKNRARHEAEKINAFYGWREPRT